MRKSRGNSALKNMKLDTTYLNPVTIDDFLFSNSYDKIFLEDILDGNLNFPAMGKTGICLHGTYGTGKTTLALQLPDMLDKSGVLGTAQRGNMFVRSPIYNLTKCKPGNSSISQINEIAERVDSLESYSQKGWHFEVLDEADLLTETAQDLLKSLMTFNKYTVFIMTTNHPSKFGRGLVDRCHMIEMNAASNQSYVDFGKKLLTKMGLSDEILSDNELLDFAKRCRGSLRDFGTDVIRTVARR